MAPDSKIPPHVHDVRRLNGVIRCMKCRQVLSEKMFVSACRGENVGQSSTRNILSVVRAKLKLKSNRPD